MAADTLLKALAMVCLLVGTTLSMPSFDSGSFDDGSLLNLNGILTPRSEPFEIRGVYGGRKKRYIVERKAACCRQKPLCLPTLGQFIKECKCEKCPTGIPALDGLSCTENCPEGQEKNDKGGCCPIGQVPKPAGDGCEARQGDDRKGQCQGNTVLDPKQGQDASTPNPKCQIDDEAKCQKPKIPATRGHGYENDATYEVECGQPDDDGPTCDPKTQYAHVSVDSNGKATHICKQTQKYYDRKGTKPTDSRVRARIKAWWDRIKPQRDQEEKDRKELRDKLKTIEAERDEEAKKQKQELEEKDKKAKRLSQCSTCVALVAGAAIDGATAKRDGEHPYEWTSDYFDEEFVISDESLADWPNDIDVNSISEDVDQESFLKKWLEVITDRKRALYNNCNFVGKRSLDRRCSQRRSLEDWYGLGDGTYGDNDLHIRSANSSILVERQTESVNHLTVSPRGSDELDKRFLGALFSMLAQFGTRLATGLAALVRSASSAVAAVTKIAKPERLFQNAAGSAGRGRGTPQGMTNARKAIKDFADWKKCLKDGLAAAI